jgi:hypothetical protein
VSRADARNIAILIDCQVCRFCKSAADSITLLRERELEDVLFIDPKHPCAGKLRNILRRRRRGRGHQHCDNERKLIRAKQAHAPRIAQTLASMRLLSFLFMCYRYLY